MLRFDAVTTGLVRQWRTPAPERLANVTATAQWKTRQLFLMHQTIFADCLIQFRRSGAAQNSETENFHNSEIDLPKLEAFATEAAQQVIKERPAILTLGYR